MLRYTASIILDTRSPKKDFTYPVKLRVTYRRKHYYFTLNESLPKEHWEKINATNARGSFRTARLKYNQLELKAGEILDKMRTFSVDALREQLFGESIKEDDLLSLLNSYIIKLRKEERFSTATTFQSTLSIVKTHKLDGRKSQILIHDITPSWLESLEEELLKHGKSVSTIGKHMRNIRVIYNLAIDKGVVHQSSYPFGKRKYQPPATTNHKRALNKEQIKALINYEAIVPQEQKARDLWLFSYLAAGINMKDMSRLRYNNIKGDVLSFYRAKTEKTMKGNLKAIEVVLHPKALEIIKDYGQKPVKENSLIFDLVTDKASKESQVKQLSNSIANINKYLKRIGNNLEFPFKLTTYTARHSYATISMKSGAPVQYISENLGHSSLEVTTKYLGSFDEDVKREWSKKLI